MSTAASAPGTAPAEAKTQLATFGAGCYWGTEKFFRKDFQKLFPKSILDVKVGFMGGKVANPSYRAVCEGTTEHVEVAQIVFDPKMAEFKDLCRFFFTMHDPTTWQRQEPDEGDQYTSAIFTHSDAQAADAKQVIAELDAMLAAKSIPWARRSAFEGDKVVTLVKPAETFYAAEDYHQDYFEKNPGRGCSHRIWFKWQPGA